MKKIIGSAAVLSALLVLSGCGQSASNQNQGIAPQNAPDTSSGMPVSQSQPSAATTEGSNNEAASSMVSIQGFAFNPGTLTVKKGTTVTWTNNDSAVHTIKSSSFNSGNLAKGDTFKFTFTTAGTFDYSCGVHPSMTGKIIVE